MSKYPLGALIAISFTFLPLGAQEDPEIQHSFQEPVSVEKSPAGETSDSKDSWADARTTFKDQKPEPRPEPVPPADDPLEFVRQTKPPEIPRPPAVSVTKTYEKPGAPPAILPHSGARIKQSFQLDRREGKSRKTFSQGRTDASEPAVEAFTTGFSGGSTRQWSNNATDQYGFRTGALDARDKRAKAKDSSGFSSGTEHCR